MADDETDYTIRIASRSLKQLREWAEEAEEQGTQEKFREAVRYIRDQLQNRPLEWGEPAFRLPGIGWLLYRGASHPLLVSYIVDEENRDVLVGVIRRLFGPSDVSP